MRKALRIVVTLMAVICLLTMSVFAESSKTITVEQTGATDNNGNAVNVTATATAESLSTEKAAQIIDSPSINSGNITVAYIQDISVPDGTVFPVTINFNVTGVTDDQIVYIFHYNGTSWELVGQGKGSTVSASFNSLSPVGIVVQKSSTSPKTGEKDIPSFAFAAMLIAGASACLLYKRKTVS